MNSPATCPECHENNCFEIPPGENWTIHALHATFNAVKNPEDWKAPIDAPLPKDASPALVHDSVIFFTATVPEFVNGRVIAEGYRMGPAGDH